MYFEIGFREIDASNPRMRIGAHFVQKDESLRFSVPPSPNTHTHTHTHFTTLTHTHTHTCAHARMHARTHAPTHPPTHTTNTCIADDGLVDSEDTDKSVCRRGKDGVLVLT